MSQNLIQRFFASWWTGRQAGRPVAVDEVLWQELLASRLILGRLPPAEQVTLRRLCGEFLATKYIEGVRGLGLTPSMELSIAAWACLPLLQLGLAWYDDWHNLFVCPGGFTDTRRRYEAGGAITEWEDDLAGQVLELGPVVLSWDDVDQAGSGGGYNVVIHEMAHKLDARNGDLDGAPPLPLDQQARWRQTFGAAWEDFGRQVARQKRRGRIGRGHLRLPMDDYAADSPAEFFAVACENFFERPLGLRLAYPAVYDCLADFFRLDPALWI